MLLAERLRMLRAKHDWTLDELAHRAQVGRVTIHRAERGSERITAPVIMRLAKTFGVTTDYLLGMDADQVEPAPAPSLPVPANSLPAPSRRRKTAQRPGTV
jgi:transcriptional regulator with XRE-family HTH domain